MFTYYTRKKSRVQITAFRTCDIRNRRTSLPVPLASYFCASYLRADYCFCAAAFCSPRLCRRGSPFACFALPRRHCSTASTGLGGQPECVDDRLLGCFLSFIHVFAFLLGRLSVSIRPDWYGLWRHSWLARADDYPLGKPTGRTFLHAEPLARTSRHVGDCRTFRLRLVARYALRQQCSWRSALADQRLRDSAFPGSRCRIDRLLSRVLRWSASARWAPRATAIQLNELGKQVADSPWRELTTRRKTINQESRNLGNLTRIARSLGCGVCRLGKIEKENPEN